MKLPYRIDLLSRLGQYILSDCVEWSAVKERAGHENGWFIPSFVELAAKNIALSFLQPEQLKNWSASYPIELDTIATNLTGEAEAAVNFKKIGIVMAGNIPLVGFHDFLCVFISGHKAVIKTSSKDQVLIKHLAEKLIEWEPTVKDRIEFSEMLKDCAAYIATGSNNSSRYFDYYFGKYPNIIRRNRTSVAILTGDETKVELEKLADDVLLRRIMFGYFPK